jgi:hypothetical protein
MLNPNAASASLVCVGSSPGPRIRPTPDAIRRVPICFSHALDVVQSQSHDELFRVLLPKIYGLLGLNEFKLGNAAKAREHTAVALRESEIVRDLDGVRIYTANLKAINEC